ncbi:MAG: MBL fold metallo-hydrolase [Deltaproteobacteria bacterium]|nr:MAG: MBL fold metallo-hydrolase [Deltaproteobacteria bacterium]
MKLTVIGSSDAFNSAGFFHSCYWLDGLAERPLMVDFGSTALSALRRAGRSPLELGGVLVTHLHGDHIGGFPHLMINSLYNEVRDEPLHVVGPTLTASRIEALFEMAYPRLSQRESSYAMHYAELLPGDAAEVLGVRVEAFAAEHMDPPDQPLCLRVTGRDGRVVAFSGDTEFCDGLLAAADGADLLVAECTAMRPPAGRHCTWVDWIERIDEVGAKRILLTHFNAEMRASLPELRRAVPSHVDLDFAADGLVVEL